VFNQDNTEQDYFAHVELALRHIEDMAIDMLGIASTLGRELKAEKPEAKIVMDSTVADLLREAYILLGDVANRVNKFADVIAACEKKEA
jgi:hypothetical protein